MHQVSHGRSFLSPLFSTSSVHNYVFFFFFSASNKTTLIPCLLIVLVNNIEGGSSKIQPHIFSPTFDFCTFILLFEASLNQSPLLISGALAVAV